MSKIKLKAFRIYRPLSSALVGLFTPGQLVHHYLLASLAYYIYDESAFEDTAYDRLCRRLVECYATLEHPHKYLLDLNNLRAGTAFTLKEVDYPLIVRSALISYAEGINNGSLEMKLFTMSASN